MLGPTQAHLYVTQINSTRSHFIGTIELITCLKFLKTNLKLKFESWLFEILENKNSEMNLKLNNFELRF